MFSLLVCCCLGPPWPALARLFLIIIFLVFHRLFVAVFLFCPFPFLLLPVLLSGAPNIIASCCCVLPVNIDDDTKNSGQITNAGKSVKCVGGSLSYLIVP